MVFEVNSNFGFPLNEDRTVKYKDVVLKNEDARKEDELVRKVDTPAEEVPAWKSQEGDHVELFATWSQLHEPNTRTRARTCPRTLSTRRTRSTCTTRTKDSKFLNTNDVVNYMEITKNEDVPHAVYLKKFVFHIVAVNSKKP